MNKPILATLIVGGLTIIGAGVFLASTNDWQVDRVLAGSSGSAAQTLEIPAGTVLTVRLDQSLSSESASEGDPVRATLAEPVHIDGKVALPAGSDLRGSVMEAKEAGRVKGNGYIKLAFQSVTLPGGGQTAISSYWEAKAEPPRKRDTAIIGGSAAGGAILGQVIGGDSESTVEGTVIGGAIGTGIVLANKGREVSLPAGQLLLLELRNGVSVKHQG